MKKLLLSLCLLVAFSLSLVACGPEVDENTLATQIVATVYAEQTAQAWAFTPMPAPSPTSTSLLPMLTDTPLRLTPTPSPPPGGGCIAFVSYRDGNAEIYVMNADGSGLTRLTNDPASDWGPSWGP